MQGMTVRAKSPTKYNSVTALPSFDPDEVRTKCIMQQLLFRVHVFGQKSRGKVRAQQLCDDPVFLFKDVNGTDISAATARQLLMQGIPFTCEKVRFNKTTAQMIGLEDENYGCTMDAVLRYHHLDFTVTQKLHNDGSKYDVSLTDAGKIKASKIEREYAQVFLYARTAPAQLAFPHPPASLHRRTSAPAPLAPWHHRRQDNASTSSSTFEVEGPSGLNPNAQEFVPQPCYAVYVNWGLNSQLGGDVCRVFLDILTGLRFVKKDINMDNRTCLLFCASVVDAEGCRDTLLELGFTASGPL